MARKPLTNAERVQRNRERLAAAGGRQINVRLSPEAAGQLDDLLDAEYADSATGVIVRALREAHKKNC